MSKNIAIIGSGLSGAILYNKLKKKNYKVTVFEKSRGAGGRCSTRYIKNRKIDHGTSNFQAHGEPFKEFCDTMAESSFLVKDQEFYKGTNGINQMVSSLLDSKDVVTRTKITNGYKKDSKWTLEDEDKKIYKDFDILLCTIPAPQILDLQIDNLQEIQDQLKSVTYDSVATLIAYGADLDENQIKKLEKNSFFRKISVQKDGIVFHTISQISNKLDSKEEVQRVILKEIESTIGINLLSTMNVIPHLWRYGFASNTLDKEYIYDETLQFGIAGDYFKGSNLETSFISSNALAQRI